MMIQVGPKQWMDAQRAARMGLKPYTPPPAARAAPAAPAKAAPVARRVPPPVAQPNAAQIAAIKQEARKEMLAEQLERFSAKSHVADWQAVYDILGKA